MDRPRRCAQYYLKDYSPGSDSSPGHSDFDGEFIYANTEVREFSSFAMPLLNRGPFIPVDIPENLQDDEKVYYCDVTGEIFRSFEAFSGRKIQLDTEVWSCEVTGKSNITYDEAVQSEREAKAAVKKVDKRLTRAILFLANKAKGRTVLQKLAHEIMAAIREIYFLGEKIKHQNKKFQIEDMKYVGLEKENMGPDALSKFVYTLEEPTERRKKKVEGEEVKESPKKQITVKAKDIKQGSRILSKPLLCYILKMHTFQCDDDRSYALLPDSEKKFKIEQTKWSEIFNGPEPKFEKMEPKKVAPKKVLNNKMMQNMMMKKMEEEERQRREKMDQAASQEQRLAEAKKALAQAKREWKMIRTDEILDDLSQHKIPPPLKIKTPLPAEFMGDALTLCEFLRTFHSALDSIEWETKMSKFSLEDAFKMLTETRTDGVFCDVLIYLLGSLQNSTKKEEEDAESKANPICRQMDSPFLDENVATEVVSEAWPIGSKFNADEVIDSCTEVAIFCAKALGDYPVKYTIDETTVTEVLRLILLSGGANPSNDIDSNRMKYRGGYQTTDSTFLNALRYEEHIDLLKKLEAASVFTLAPEERLRLVMLLTDVLIVEGEIRYHQDEMDEKILEITEEIKEIRKNAKEEKVRLGQELHKLRIDLMEMKKANPQPNSVALRKIEDLQTSIAEKESLAASNEQDTEASIDDANARIQTITLAFRPIYLGSDRFHRRYMISSASPGLIVEVPNRNEIPLPANADSWENYKIPELKKQPKLADFMEIPKGRPAAAAQADEVMEVETQEILLSENTKAWTESALHEPGFYIYDEEATIRVLYEGLNERGEREKTLKERIQRHFFLLTRDIDKAGPGFYKNGKLLQFSEPEPGEKHDVFDKEILLARDFILELEERIFKADFGDLESGEEEREALREFWLDRKLIRSRDYMKALLEKDENLFLKFNDDKDIERTMRVPNYLSEPNSDSEEFFEVQNLAGSVIALRRAIRQDVLLRPLGTASNKKGNKREKNEVWKAVYNSQKKHWESSLLSVRSPAALMLHLIHLEECINWSQSIENIRCQKCKKKSDGENMIICDGCETAFHTYCHKPKIRKIPSGDWYCKQCKAEQEKQQSPKKSRRSTNIFEIDEDLELRPRKRNKVDYKELP